MPTKIETVESLVNNIAVRIHHDRRKAQLFSSSFILNEDEAAMVNSR
jgi:hypothetical protein